MAAPPAVIAAPLVATAAPPTAAAARPAVEAASPAAVLRIALGVYGSRHGATTLVTSDSVPVMLGLTLLIQNLTVHTRYGALARDRVTR